MMRNNTNKGILGREIRRNLTSYIMLSPYMILFIVLTVIPVVAAIALSFTSFNMLEVPKFSQLTNYIRLFCDDEIFPKVLRNTLLFAIVTGPIGYMLSFFTAWAVNELGPKLRTFFTFCFYSPALTGSLYVIWVFIFSGDEYGVANSLLQNIGLIMDVGAIEYIHGQLVAQRDAGKAVLLVSLELEEVMNVPDRILVMYEGEIVGEFDPKTTTVEELGLYMAGAKREVK